MIGCLEGTLEKTDKFTENLNLGLVYLEKKRCEHCECHIYEGLCPEECLHK